MATVNRPREFREFESHTYHVVRSSMVERLIVVQKTGVRFPSYTPSPHRLMVRTPGFHPGNRSSILLGGTDKEALCQSMNINVSNVIQNKH